MRGALLSSLPLPRRALDPAVPLRLPADAPAPPWAPAPPAGLGGRPLLAAGLGVREPPDEAARTLHERRRGARFGRSKALQCLSASAADVRRCGCACGCAWDCARSGDGRIPAESVLTWMQQSGACTRVHRLTHSNLIKGAVFQRWGGTLVCGADRSACSFCHQGPPRRRSPQARVRRLRALPLQKPPLLVIKHQMRQHQGPQATAQNRQPLSRLNSK